MADKNSKENERDSILQPLSLLRNYYRVHIAEKTTTSGIAMLPMGFAAMSGDGSNPEIMLAIDFRCHFLCYFLDKQKVAKKTLLQSWHLPSSSIATPYKYLLVKIPSRAGK